MNSPRARPLWAMAAGAVLAAFLGACATQTGTVVLLPEKDGHATAVTVKQGDKEAERRFREIQAAYDVLKSAEERKNGRVA